MNETERGEKLLSAVERIVADPDEIIVFVDEISRKNKAPADANARRQVLAQAIIDKFSTNSAISGGAAALPGIVPGLGTLVAVAGGTLVDMALMLKFEVEMALALTWLYGFDIREEKERQFAFLLASVNTYEAKSGRNFFVDLAAAEGTAIWNYAPRQASKVLVSVMAKLALLSISKGFLRAIPLVGVAVGGGMNKVLTSRVGKRSREELERRRFIADKEAAEGDVVEARVRDEGVSA